MRLASALRIYPPGRQNLCVMLCGLISMVAALPVIAAGDEHAESDRTVILELGAAVERDLSEHALHISPAVGIEIEPIENWLEIELGAATYRTHGSTDWELELPFKKPFRLSSTVEIMPGLGPTWSHTTQPGEPSSTWGAEAVVDFFFWRSKRFGWYLEPSYGLNWGHGAQKSAALTGGIFLAVP